MHVFSQGPLALLYNLHFDICKHVIHYSVFCH